MRFLIHWLLTHLHLFHAGAFLAAGAFGIAQPSADEGGGGGEFEGMDLGDEGEGALGNETEEGAETLDDGTQTDEALAAATVTVNAARDQKALGVSPTALKLIDGLKETAPKEYKELRVQLFQGAQARKQLEALKEDFPNGVADVVAMKAAMEETFGSDDLETLGAQIATYRQLGSLLEKKDPGFVKQLFEGNAPEMAALFPEMLRTFRALSPDGGDKMVANWVVNEINAAQIPSALTIMQSNLTHAHRMTTDENVKAFIETALGIVNNINEWSGNLKTISQQTVKDVAGRAKPGADPNQTAQDQREFKLFERELNLDVVPHRNQAINTALDAIIKATKKQVTPDQRGAIVRDAILKMNSALAAQSDWKSRYLGLEKKRDVAALSQFIKSRLGPVLNGANGKPGVVALAFRAITGTGMAAKKTEPGDKGAAAGATRQNAPAAGWIKVAKAPLPSEISRAATEAAGRAQGMKGDNIYEMMCMRGKYVLRDGRKLFTSK